MSIYRLSIVLILICLTFNKLFASESFPHEGNSLIKKDFYFKKLNDASYLSSSIANLISRDINTLRKIRVMTYNVHEFKDVYNRNRKSEIFKFLNQVDASVTGLQEVSFEDWEKLDGLSKNFNSIASKTCRHGSNFIGNALLTKLNNPHLKM